MALITVTFSADRGVISYSALARPGRDEPEGIGGRFGTVWLIGHGGNIFRRNLGVSVSEESVSV
jgi:hypothetical protein